MKPESALLKTPEERMQMRDLINEEREKIQKEYNKKRQNEGFTQVYDRGWVRLRSLITQNRSAAILYSYLAQHLDASCGALVASQEVLGEETGLSRTTLWRASKYLEEAGALIRFTVGGSVYAYALNEAEIWKSWDSAKEASAFRTKTLARKSDQPGRVQRRIQFMVNDRKEADNEQ
ncbi:replication/maintenance protein RepL [Celeribacter neptunius]|uniref:Replication protein (RepL) n=1 Tax=Celeribacter neptunius TaxID=588602 RepID=A0A1I3P169_9RHOB|nr:replication/maintenance protein RepL [Celeribacter neptunius]SFJ15303.1 replication protein (RepL) [Celeribacter neptunius]